jgi:aspartate/methionine/tyrosine aminotransferase
MFAALLAIVSHGDEVLIVQPHYDAYPAQVQMCGGVPKFISMKPLPHSTSSADWKLDIGVIRFFLY